MMLYIADYSNDSSLSSIQTEADAIKTPYTTAADMADQSSVSSKPRKSPTMSCSTSQKFVLSATDHRFTGSLFADISNCNSQRRSDTLQQLDSASEGEVRLASQLLCDLCVSFYKLGWNMGTGGGVSLQTGDLIFLSPSGVHKERMSSKDLFIYSVRSGDYIYKPENKKPSASSSLFLWLHEHHGAGAVIHTHSLYANLATNLGEVWSIQDQEYIKGVPRYSANVMLQNTDRLEIPIISNRATEDQLLPDLEAAVKACPDAACVLVKNHGAYHFGKDIWRCKAQAECLEYLFELSWKLRSIR